MDIIVKIVHICLANFYVDNYSYQENMLPKFHKMQGHSVEIIASLETFDENGRHSYLANAKVYKNEYGIKVTRLKYRNPVIFNKKFKQYVGTYDALEGATPDVLFIHGCQFLDLMVMRKYLRKHKTVQVFLDNHTDPANSATNWLSKNILHKVIWKRQVQLMEPYIRKFYGVLPARVEFLINMYGLPRKKCELLVMGADDESVRTAAKPEVSEMIREKHHIRKDDFLIVTGGKIDTYKKQILCLMEAVQNMNNDKIKLIVFGSVVEHMQEEVNRRADGTLVQYIGWVQSEDTYPYFAASDLVVFPCGHSVFWEQVVAQGIPMLCKYWEGATHVDIGGNVKFLRNDTVEETQEIIELLISKPEEYESMKNIAISGNRSEFFYSHIARKSLGKGCGTNK
ncbi:MAG: glycosyltransferase [Eubacteriales bacterium]